MKNKNQEVRKEFPILKSKVNGKNLIYVDNAATTQKPKRVIYAIQKYYEEACLLKQPFVKDPDKTIEILLKELVAKLGENCAIRRFVRFQLGEGLEKRNEDFAAEVAKQIK